MQCPRCGTEEIIRYRSPKNEKGAVLRRHKCQECGLLFLSAQVVVVGPLAEKLVPLLSR